MVHELTSASIIRTLDTLLQFGERTFLSIIFTRMNYNKEDRYRLFA
jgi:hypothetical protein